MKEDKQQYTLRPVEPGDDLFLFTLFALDHESECELFPWSVDTKRAFLYQRFAEQQAAVETTYPTAMHYVIEVGERPAGRLWIRRTDFEIRLLDVTVLQSFRDAGLGVAVVHDVLANSERMRLPVRLHVERDSPAKRFYDRLGFAELEQHGSYWFMEWCNSELVGKGPRYAATPVHYA